MKRTNGRLTHEAEQMRAVSKRIDSREVPGDLFIVVPRLRTISKALSKLAEGQCNGVWDYADGDQKPNRQERREKRLQLEASTIAPTIGATAYFQCDPRGAALYLIFPGDIPDGIDVDACYSNGVAIY
jgi:hypothetical protein